ncbi:BCAS3 microtubule associated cell migration factor-like [Ruditapes philippinarum]|uniref:BCAS3 microtubule associated cell migration factor-like n=1 Tax=Ruditapes philippinarum TaxID=129788 RepID=UPI00295B36ED|nr:BCAS3 microtubule associated cell migration factor-like [Ruditapes philippinarum]
MSADPPRKAYKYTCSMMRPQIYSEKSLMESVVDFFSDVVPQAYTGTQKNEDREKIQWVRFENCDCNDVAKNPDMFRSDTKGLPLLLILGYSNGVQIWHVTPNGEAQEVLSMRQGPVRICRILPNPDPVLGNGDSFSHKRPLIVMCDSSSAGQPYCGVKFVSLKTGDEVHSISYKTLPVQNIECNKRFLVNIFLEKVCVYETCAFQQLFWITSCYPCSGPTVNPIALSTRWLAYADKRLVPMHQSCGGMSGDGSQSYAATVISAAKGAFKGLSMFGEAMVSSVTGCKPSPVKRDCVTLDNGNRPGIVTVVDIQNIHNDHFNVNEDNEGDGLIAHFHAHANEPVSNMAFDPTGTLLVTACKLGHNFHVFRLMAHPVSSSLGAVHHLYTLHRGETTAKVIDISFNHDSRWITVSSHRGTTHLFPITPYGGSVNIRTHCKPHVVNRASRFHRSAGLDEFDHSVGRRSPVLSTSPSSSGQYDRYPTLIQQNTLNNNMGNPRLPPYPHPITIYPTFQVKQPLNVALNPGNKNQSPSHSPTGFDNVYCVCAKFCTPRLCVIGSPKLDVERRDGGKRPVDSLFVMAQSGTLVEYVLEPRAKSVSDKVTDDCLLELNVVGRMQWNLQRLKNSPELRPPLPSNSPLILSHEAVVSQIPTAPDLYDLPGLTRQDSKDSLSSEHSSKDDSDEQWLSQVEIITHAGPHRRLWMGPQFSFKTYQENTTVLSSNSSSLLSQSPESNMAAMDMMGDEGDLESLKYNLVDNEFSLKVNESATNNPRASVRAEKARDQGGKKNVVEKNEGAGVIHKEKTRAAKKEGLAENIDLCPDTSVQKINSPNKNKDEKLSSSENMKTSEIKMLEKDKGLEIRKSISPEAVEENMNSNFDTVVKSKGKKKRKNESTNEKDLVATSMEHRKVYDFKYDGECTLKSEISVTKDISRNKDDKQERNKQKPKESERNLSLTQEAELTESENDTKKQNVEVNDKLKSSEFQSAVSDKEPVKSNSFKSDEDMFQVKSKKNRKKKKNMFEDSCYGEIPKDSEKQTDIESGVNESHAIKEVVRLEETDVKKENYTEKTEYKFEVSSVVEKIPDELSEVCDTGKEELSAVASNNDNIVKVKNSKVCRKDEPMSNDKDENPNIESGGKSEVLETTTLQKNEQAQAEMADEEMFVVTKKKGKKKKKNGDTSTESPCPSSENKVTKGKSTVIENVWSNKKTLGGCQETENLLEEKQGNIKETRSEIKEDKNLNDTNSDKKSKSTTWAEISVDSNEEPQKIDEEDDEFGVIIMEKKMEDSAESGSKYETADSAEDDPSAWERFEECSEENESERDTAVESCSNISNEMNEAVNDLPGKSKSSGSVNKANSSNEIEINEGNDHFDESSLIKSEKASPLSETNDEKSFALGTKNEVGVSAMSMSVYDDSPSSSSRSSEERDVNGKVKTSPEKESKSKKKKKKNRK